MTDHAIVSREEWVKARKRLLEQEKELTRRRDAVNAERRKLPWVEVEKLYAFEGLDGPAVLADLFQGRSQLIVYHFMFGPDWSAGCPSCSLIADGMDGARPHLAARDVTLAVVSRAPFARIAPFKKRMGWRFPWYSSFGSDFNFDFHVSFTPEEIASGTAEYNFARTGFPIEEGPGLSVFYRQNTGEIYHTYSTYARGGEPFIVPYHYLDIAPKGRNEESLAFSMAWVRLHDRYGPDYFVDPMAQYAPPPKKSEGCPACAEAHS